jgi:hypothetical protein
VAYLVSENIGLRDTGHRETIMRYGHSSPYRKKSPQLFVVTDIGSVICNKWGIKISFSLNKVCGVRNNFINSAFSIIESAMSVSPLAAK